MHYFVAEASNNNNNNSKLKPAQVMLQLVEIRILSTPMDKMKGQVRPP
jgi:hypothetical protein